MPFLIFKHKMKTLITRQVYSELKFQNKLWQSFLTLRMFWFMFLSTHCSFFHFFFRELTFCHIPTNLDHLGILLSFSSNRLQPMAWNSNSFFHHSIGKLELCACVLFHFCRKNCFLKNHQCILSVILWHFLVYIS